jgi:vancomycin permeability regulator SanA
MDYSELNLEPQTSGRRSRFKRVLFLVVLTMQIASYVVLTQARYECQGLAPIYFRLSTLSDSVSIFFSFLTVIFLILAILNPNRISLARATIITIFSASMLWVDLGIHHTPSGEFTPEAAIAFLCFMFLFLATLFTPFSGLLRPIRRVLRILRVTVLISGVLLFLSFLYGYFYPTYSLLDEIISFHADAGVILGAAVWHGNGLGERPSPALKERIDLGHELLISHAIPRLIVTGGNAPGKLAEGEVAESELLRLGVDSSLIIEENSSHSTFEQVRFLRDDLFQKHGWNRFVIVSDQYHLARVCEMCAFSGLSVIGSPSHIHEPFLDLAYYRIRESVALLEYWFLGR